MLLVAFFFRECKDGGIPCWPLCVEELALSVPLISLLAQVGNSLLVVDWLVVCLLSGLSVV